MHDGGDILRAFSEKGGGIVVHYHQGPPHHCLVGHRDISGSARPMIGQDGSGIHNDQPGLQDGAQFHNGSVQVNRRMMDMSVKAPIILIYPL